jgi:hypothetical protein
MLLRTTFTAAILGYEDSAKLVYRLPDAPPMLFARMRTCGTEEQSLFVQTPGFLEPLLRGDDDLAGAFLRRSSSMVANPRAFLLEMGRCLVPLLSADPERLNRILRHIRPAEATYG